MQGEYPPNCRREAAPAPGITGLAKRFRISGIREYGGGKVIERPASLHDVGHVTDEVTGVWPHNRATADRAPLVVDPHKPVRFLVHDRTVHIREGNGDCRHSSGGIPRLVRTDADVGHFRNRVRAPRNDE